jgi:hypothetical protein
VYQRIVAVNPAARGQAYNFAVSGSGVDSLADQEKQAAAVTPAPDLVIIQSIDNDIHCDGTDPQNYGPYRRKLTAVMDSLTRDLPDATIFFVDQPADVRHYDQVVIDTNPSHITGTGPCDTIDAVTGELDPKREAYLQRVVDHYFAIITAVCARYPNCRTDEGLMQTMPLEKGDLTEELDHLSVTGHHKMAAMVFDYLYG